MMMRHSSVRTVLMSLALVAMATAAHAATPRTTPSSTASPTRTVGAVSALSIVANAGKTEVILAVDGEVDVTDFILSTPQHRVVIDLKNAVLAGTPVLYDKIARGGIVNVRLAQFKADVVRLVLELDGPHGYQVAKGDGSARTLNQILKGTQAVRATLDKPAKPPTRELAVRATVIIATTRRSAKIGSPTYL